MADISIWQFGADAKLYYHETADTALADMDECDSAIDVNINLEKADINITKRASGGHKSAGSGHKDTAFDATIQWSKDDAFICACRAAWLNNTTLDLCPMTGDRDTGGNEGPRATFEIFSISEPQPLEDRLVINISGKLQTWRAWEQVST